MTYETYRNIFMICAAAGGIMAFVSVLLFVLLRIPSVIGDLTGITAKRGIEQIRNKESKAGNRKYGSGRKNRQRGQPAAGISPSGTLQGQEQQRYGAGTEKLQNMPVSEETALLSSDAAGETTILQPEFGVLEDITILHTEEEI